MGDFFISADLAQVNDYTAITITERIIQAGNDETDREYHLRHIERPERGTTYPKIVSRLKELANSTQLTDMQKRIVIDITGVGRPVWDLLKDANFDGYTILNGIMITGGNAVTQDTQDSRIYHVPKRDLVSSLQVAFQNGQIKIPRNLPNADTLIKELNNFKVKINLNGHDQYEAWRDGIHDDIVLSAAMGVWLASQPVNDWSLDVFDYSPSPAAPNEPTGTWLKSGW